MHTKQVYKLAQNQSSLSLLSSCWFFIFSFHSFWNCIAFLLSLLSLSDCLVQKNITKWPTISSSIEPRPPPMAPNLEPCKFSETKNLPVSLIVEQFMNHDCSRERMINEKITVPGSSLVYENQLIFGGPGKLLKNLDEFDSPYALGLYD